MIFDFSGMLKPSHFRKPYWELEQEQCPQKRTIKVKTEMAGHSESKTSYGKPPLGLYVRAIHELPLRTDLTKRQDMKFDPQNTPSGHLHHRRSIRVPDYDYSQPGAYFITIITRGRECLFGEIKDGRMHLNNAGQIVWGVWNSLPARYPQIALGVAVLCQIIFMEF